MSEHSRKLILALAIAGVLLIMLSTFFGDWIAHEVAPSTPPHSPPVSLKTPRALPQLSIRSNVFDAVKEPRAQKAEASNAESDTGAEDTPDPKKIAEIHGMPATLTNQEISEAISAHHNQFQRCWTERLKDVPQLKGQMTFQMIILPRGKIADLQLIDTNIKDQLMQRCVETVLDRITFRAFTGAKISLSFPLNFE